MMDDGFLVRVLHILAGVNEKLQSFPDLELVLIAVLGDGQPGNELHYQVRLPLKMCASIEDLGDGRMIHDGEELAFGLKTLYHRLVVHPRRIDNDLQKSVQPPTRRRS